MMSTLSVCITQEELDSSTQSRRRLATLGFCVLEVGSHTFYPTPSLANKNVRDVIPDQDGNLKVFTDEELG